MTAPLSPSRGSEIRAVLRAGRWWTVPLADWARMVQDLIADNDRLSAEAAGMDRVVGNAADDVKALVDTNLALQKRLEQLEALTPQQCPRGLHADWAVDSVNVHACPWCLIAELRGVKADLEDRLAARLIELAARPTWSAAADVAEDARSTLAHHNLPEQATGADKVRAVLRAKAVAVEAGEGRG